MLFGVGVAALAIRIGWPLLFMVWADWRIRKESETDA